MVASASLSKRKMRECVGRAGAILELKQGASYATAALPLYLQHSQSVPNLPSHAHMQLIFKPVPPSQRHSSRQSLFATAARIAGGKQWMANALASCSIHSSSLLLLRTCLDPFTFQCRPAAGSRVRRSHWLKMLQL